MSEETHKTDNCEHETNYYVEEDAPIVLARNGRVRYVTYRCFKCGKQIYKENPWEEFKLAV